MERLYALGVSVIEIIQDWFIGSERYFEVVNDVSSPHNALDVLFPLVAVVDSVFATQLVLCMAVGTWLNAVMKWWFLEDRPYWWVRETDFYPESQRPVLRQTHQTCETGPGFPSGHSQTAAMLLLLLLFWIAHVFHDRKLHVWWWKLVLYPLFGFALASVIMARMFVAAHFPHQCIIGALLGALLAPALCIYVSDPYIWQYGYHTRLNVSSTRFWHVMSALLAAVIGLVTFFSLKVCGYDPLWTVRLAFRWCEAPEYIHVSTTPMFTFVHSLGYMLGWALSVTPAVARYRHYTKERSLVVASIATTIVMFGLKHFQESICKDVAWQFYAVTFIVSLLKPPLLLRIAPALAMWPYETPEKIKRH